MQLDTTALLTELVAIDSTNLTLDPHGAGEGAMATRLGGLLDRLGFTVSMQEVSPGRPNVLGVRHGDPSLPTLLFEAHLDTVPAPPGGIPIRREGDRLFGRGSCDCKGALAAMLCALEQVIADDASLPTLLIAGVVDEETAMTGSAALLAALPPIAGAVIAEPTSLLPVRAHHGVVRVAVTAHGRSAHAATAHLGVNAVLAAARALDALDRDLVRPLAATDHTLTGPATLTPTVIHGGIAPNIVPDACEVILDRRTAPGTTSATALTEIDAVLESLRRAGDDLRLGSPFVALPSVETPADDPIVTAAERAASSALGRPVIAGGVAFATDACHLLGTGGIPSVVLGPGSIDQAHTADEWVDLREVETAVAVYTGIVREFARMLPAER
jgi:succinyl-diaminopimelate desuccinylase